MRFGGGRPGIGASAIEDQRRVAHRAIDGLDRSSQRACCVMRPGCDEQLECLTQ